MTTPQWLYVAAGVLAASGVVLRLAPTGLPTSDPAVAVAAPPAPRERVTSRLAGSAAIVESNVFSPRRAPPATRFVPDWARRDSTPPPVARRAQPVEPSIRLYGIARGGAGAVALIDADPRVPGAEVYRVGDLVRGSRVTAVTDSTVVLSGRTGSLVLRLPAGAAGR